MRLIVALHILTSVCADAVPDGAPGGETEQDDAADVVQLSEETFNNFLDTHNKTLIHFYQPDCPHCQRLEPEFQLVAKHLRSRGLPTRLASVNVRKHEGLRDYAVNGTPAVLFIENGTHVRQIEEELTARSIVSVALTYSGPIVITELLHSEVQEFLEQSAPGTFALVAYLSDKTSTAFNAYRVAYSNLMKSFNITVLSAAVVWNTPNEPLDSLLMWRAGFRDPDRELLQYTGKWSSKAIFRWATEGTYAIINRYYNWDLWTPDKLEEMKCRGIVAYMAPAQKTDTVIENELLLHEQLGKLGRSGTGWHTMWFEEQGLDPAVAEYFNPPPARDPPLLSVLSTSRMKKYVLAGVESLAAPDAVEQFLADIQANKVPAVRRSAPPPGRATSDTGVITLVADTFDDFVLDQKKHVLVVFTSSSCEVCGKYEDVLEEVALRLFTGRSGMRAKERVALAKIDMAENDVDEVLTTVPKVVLYPAVKASRKIKDRLVYAGPKTFEKTLAFLEDQIDNLVDEL
eukprot:TRINITY_DN36065_c0_g1_i2.p1 TRINITY_DN36065_c0_g1~~TRINITY_DN36065_c0_g1_i2.p1  ORF type:complete len:515 (-),score=95.63 TRINITY_DN36065_c0_g1_i2:452-1996(-)